MQVEEKPEKAQARSAEQEGPVFIKNCRNQDRRSRCRRIYQINVKPGEVKATAEQSVMQIATQHLGPGASSEQIQATRQRNLRTQFYQALKKRFTPNYHG